MNPAPSLVELLRPTPFRVAGVERGTTENGYLIEHLALSEWVLDEMAFRAEPGDDVVQLARVRYLRDRKRAAVGDITGRHEGRAARLAGFTKVFLDNPRVDTSINANACFLDAAGELSDRCWHHRPTRNNFTGRPVVCDTAPDVRIDCQDVPHELGFEPSIDGRSQVLHVEPLAAGALEEACTLIAAEQAAAQLMLPNLPADFTDPGTCRATLAGLLANEHVGVVARDRGRLVGVMCAKIREPQAILPAEGLAIDPELGDATAVLVALYSSMAPELLAAGSIQHHATHVNLGPVGIGLCDLGFGRSGVYATQPARPPRSSPDFEVRVGIPDDLETIVALSAVELGYRFTPPIYASPQPSTLEHLTVYHSRLLTEGAVHLLAREGRADVGLLTLEFTSPAPRLCATGQPYIGPTATHPNHRGKGVGRALVDAALGWAHAHDFHNVSVDFESANPLSRPFWLGVGFGPTGYQVTRSIHPKYIAERQR